MKQSVGEGRGSVYVIILKALQTGDKYGYEICKEIEEKSEGKYILKQPSLYSGLKRLESKKLVSSYIKESDFAPNRRYYTLTESGKKKIDNTDFSWEDFRDEFMTGLFEKKIKSNSIQTSFLPIYNNEAVEHEEIKPDNKKSKLNFHTVSPFQQDIFSLVSDLNFSNEVETSSNNNVSENKNINKTSTENNVDSSEENIESNENSIENNQEEKVEYLDSSNKEYTTSSLNDILTGKKYSNIEDEDISPKNDNEQTQTEKSDNSSSISEINDYESYIDNLNLSNSKSYLDNPPDDGLLLKNKYSYSNNEDFVEQAKQSENTNVYEEAKVKSYSNYTENETKESTYNYNSYTETKDDSQSYSNDYSLDDNSSIMTNTLQNSYVNNINKTLEPEKVEYTQQPADYNDYDNNYNQQYNQNYEEEPSFNETYSIPNRRQQKVFECKYEVRRYNKNTEDSKQKLKFVAINKINLFVNCILAFIMLSLEVVTALFLDKHIQSPGFTQYFVYILMALIIVGLVVVSYLKYRDDPDKRFVFNDNFSQTLFIDICTGLVLLLLIFSINYFCGMKIATISDYATTLYVPACISVALILKPLIRKCLEKFDYFYL